MTHNTVVVGHEYYLGLFLQLDHGPIDEISEIRYGGRTAWQGSYTGPGSLEYTDVSASAGTWPVGLPYVPILAIGESRYRRDRVVLEGDTLDIRIVIGTETSDSDPDAPDTPSDTISLAVVRSYSGVRRDRGFVEGGTFYSPDNSPRIPDLFEDPDNDLQVSFTGGVTSLPEYEVSAGAIKTERISSSLFIDKPELFGGQEGEGGIRGKVSVQMGTADQPVNDYLKRTFGDVPAFRNVAGLIMERIYVGTVSRLKSIGITRKRQPRATGLDPAYAMIGEDANPAHIIYEIIISRRWGMDYGQSRIRTSEFEAAAQTLYGEDFGLSLEWSSADEDAEAFILRVADHIDASVYVDIATGEYRIALHREDYVTDDLPLIDRSTVVRTVDVSRPGYGEIVSQLTVRYTDGEDGEDGHPPTWKTKAVTQHDIGALRANGGRTVTRTIDYPGICKGSLANRVLARDLRELSRPLARVELLLPASWSTVRPGDVYRYSDPDYGIAQLVIRVGEVKYGTIQNGKVRIKAIEDVFATADAVYAQPTPTQWVNPVQPPAPAPHRRLAEATYRHWAERLDGSGTLLAEVADDAARLITQAVAPAGSTFGYQVYIDHGHGYERDDDTGQHCPTATLARAAVPGDTVVVFQQGSTVDLDRVDTGAWAYLGDEIVRVDAIDAVGNTATVSRGMIDTVPAAHAVGTRIWFGEGRESYSAHKYTTGEQIDVAILPTTGEGTLKLADAPADTITFQGRFHRPYPPGNVRIGGERYPELLFAPLTVTWSHRDRTQQTGALIAQDAGDIGPEPGTTYTLRVLNRANSTQLVEKTGLTGTSYDDSDGADTLTPTSAPVQITIELSDQRDGLDSWQTHKIDIDRRGYAFVYNDAAGNLTYGGFAANA